MAQSRAEIDLTERAGNGRNYTHEERRERELRERRERERESERSRCTRGAYELEGIQHCSAARHKIVDVVPRGGLDGGRVYTKIAQDSYGIRH
tara:strand:+ start:1314 stop:1592 length:279 start_codon:yes stop_codon:yes gene_type:complete